MSIATRITSIEEHIGDIYDTLELGGFNPYKLPKEYTQVDYIQSSGTQYIDTGFKPTQNTTKIIVDGTYLTADLNYFAGLVKSGIYYGVRPANVSGALDWHNATSSMRVYYTYLNTRLNYKYDGYKFYINDDLKADFTTGSNTHFDINLYLFARNNTGTADAKSQFRMYSCKIYDNNMLVRDYIPCYRNSDNEVGLYDLVNNVFYTNQGTGTFTYGAVNREKTTNKNIQNVSSALQQKYLDYMNNGTREIWNNWEKVPTATGENVTLNNTIQAPMDLGVKGNSEQATSILPTGYTQLDYIESTGTQYIDTGIKPDTTLEFDTTFNTSNDLSTNGYGCIFGSRVGSGNKDIQLTTYSEFGYSGTIRWGNTYGGNAYLSNNTKINVELKDNKYYVDNEEKQSITINDSNNYNIFIFALNAGGTVSQHGKLKLYKFKLWENDTLVRDYIPCKNASDEVGLYDLVSETFFGNIGSGTFTAGDVSTVPNPDFEVPIQNVTGDVEVLVQNKNLFDKDNVVYENGKILNDSGTEISDSTGGYTKMYIAVQPNTQYAISGLQSGRAQRIYYFDKNKTFISRTSSFNTSSTTITTPNNCYYIDIQYYTSGNDFNTYQIEKGSASTYTPHQEQTLPLTLGNIELCKIGDYQDYFYKENNKWYLYKTINKVDMGDLTWVYGAGRLYTNSSTSLINGNEGANIIPNNILCTVYSKITPATWYAKTTQGLSVGGNGYGDSGAVLVYDSNYTNGTTFKNDMSGNYLYWGLKEPTSTEITDTTLISQLDAISNATSYNEQTNISGSSDELNPIFTVVALKNI